MVGLPPLSEDERYRVPEARELCRIVRRFHDRRTWRPVLMRNRDRWTGKRVGELVKREEERYQKTSDQIQPSSVEL